MLAPHRFEVATSISRPRRIVRRWIVFSAAISLALAATASPLQGANGTWSSTATTGAWQTTANWVSGIVPGATSTSTNTDTATFFSSSSTTLVLPDAGRNLENITFDLNAVAYTIGTTGGNSLVLTAGGTIQIANSYSGTNVTETVNAPLTLEGNYTFADNTSNTGDLLSFGGAIFSGVAGTQTLTVSGTDNTTINGAIGGGFGTIALVKSGAGLLALGGNNVFGGGLTVNQGTLQIATINNAGTNGTLGQNASVTLGTGGFIAALDYTGATAAASNMPFALSGAVGGFQVDNAATDLTLSGTISGSSAALVKTGPGTLTLSGNNSFGALTVQTGTLQVANVNNALTNGPLGNEAQVVLGTTGQTGTLEYTGPIATSNIGFVLSSGAVGKFQIDSASTNLTLSGDIIGGGGAVMKTGPGILTLSGSNNFSGGLTVQSGPLRVPTGINNANSAGPLGSNASVTLGASGQTGTLEYSGLAASSNMPFLLATGGVGGFQVDNPASNLTLSGTISGAGELATEGQGTLTLSGNNTFTGGVAINSGTLVLGNANALGSTVPLTSVAVGATLDLGGQQLGGGPPLAIHGTGVGGNGALVNSGLGVAAYGGTINSGNPSQFTVGGTGDIELSGGFNAPNTLTKVGTNTLTLAGTTDNSSLGLNVNGGTVVLAKTSSATVHAVGANVFLNGGTLQLAGTGGDQIPDNKDVEFNASGAVFDTNGRSETMLVVDLFGSGINGGGALMNSASAASVLTPFETVLEGDTTISVPEIGGSLTLNNQIFDFFSGSHVLTKIGLGTLILTSADTSAGPLKVNAGTLMLNGGSVATDVINSATFVYAGTSFGGRLTNTGTTTLNVDFAPGNGMENDGLVNVAAGVNITLNGAGLLNSGSLSMTGGTLTLSTSGTNQNIGSISLSSAARLNLTSATLFNVGMLNLNGALVNGSGGNLVNAAGGDVSGTGTINSAFINSGGLLSVGGGAISITQAFSSFGVIQLTAFNSALTGGAVTNTGSIQGLGDISNDVTNSANGTIEAIGGTLFLGRILANQSGAIIRAATGNKVLVTLGLPTNAGIINLVGGTFDNNGHSLNNTGQVSGFGIFATGGTGLDNNGSITFSGGLTTVNGPVTNEGGKTITLAQNNAIFTGLVTNNASATFNAVNAVATFAGGFVNNGNSNFVKAGGGTVEIDTAPTLNNGSTLSITTGTLRFNVVSGAPTIGTGVTAVVSTGATLELAGSVSALANGLNRVNIINNSNVPGVLVSGTNQQVGNIDGPGTTQVNAGSDLTANHIVQTALVIGGTSKNPGLVTIDASDQSGNPLGQSLAKATGLILGDSLASGDPFDAGISSASSIDGLASSDSGSAGVSPSSSPPAAGSSAVPELSTIVLFAVALVGLLVYPCCTRRPVG